MARLFGLLLLFFPCWVVPSVIVFHLPLPSDTSLFQLDLTAFFFTGFYLLIASSFAFRVMDVIFDEGKKVLAFMVCFSVALFFLIYIYTRFFEHSMLIAASISTANLIFVSSVIGAGLSSAVTRLAELVPICITAAIADLTSVLQGPTKKMIESLSMYYVEGMVGDPPLVDFILIKVGIPEVDVPVPLFGMTDWIFVVLISSAMVRLQKNDNLFGQHGRTGGVLYFPVAAAALFVAIVFAQITNIFVPAMVIISSVFIGFLAIKFKIHKEMIRTDFIYSLLFPAIIVMVILTFVRK